MNNDQLPPRNHRTSKYFFSVLRGSSKYNRYKKKRPSQIVQGTNNRQFIDFYDFVDKLEALQPSNANSGKIVDDSPQLEYPWKNSGIPSVYCSPCNDLDIIHEIVDPQSRLFSKILPIAQNLINDFPHFYSTKRFP
jgi:hypothetical protein